jgi:death-on-curing protein
VDAALAATVKAATSALKYSAVVEVCRAIGRPEWIAPLTNGDPSQIPELKPAQAPRIPEPTAHAVVERSVEIVEPPQESRATGTLPTGPAGVRAFHPLTTPEILQAHWALVAHFRKSRDPIEPPGVKSNDLLESAVSRQHTSFNGVPKYRTLSHLAAALLYGLALNHPFHNGNKRTALLSLMLLLDRNDYVLTAKEAELFEFILKTVNHGFRPQRKGSPTVLLDEEVRAIGSWVSSHCRRVDRRLRPIDWRALRRRLKELGCETHVLKGNYIEITLGAQKTTLAFGGDDREVTKATQRQIWRELGLNEVRVYDAAAFYGAGAPVDRFIVQYLEVFQRLAHA